MTRQTAAKAAFAAFVGATAMWILAGVWHEILARHLYEATERGPHQGVLLIFVAYVLLAVIMTFFLRHTRVSDNALIHGTVIGAVIGLLWVFPHEFSVAVAHGEPLDYVFVNGLWHVVEQGAGGAIIASVMRALERGRPLAA